MKIERNFYQSCKDKDKLHHKISSSIQINKDKQKNFKHYLLDDNDINKIYMEDMQNEELKDIARRSYECTKVIKPGPFKADIFRYYILYTRGGVWLDDKSKLNCDMEDPIFSLDIHDGFLIYGSWIQGVEIAFMATRSKSPLFYLFLDKCLRNIENREYGRDCLNITGPTMAYDVINSHTSSNGDLLSYKDYNYKILRTSVYFPWIELYLNGKVIWTQNPHFLSLDKISSAPRYAWMWREGNIYTDNNDKAGLSLSVKIIASLILFVTLCCYILYRKL